MKQTGRRRWLAGSLVLALSASGLGWATGSAAQTVAGAGDASETGAPPEVRTALAAPALQGQGQLRFLGLRVYEARLWAPAGQPVAPSNWAQPLALEIRYQRALQGQQIAERSLQEMKRQGDIDEATAQRWLQTMQGLFPDVVAGTRITGVHQPREGAQFYVNGRLKGAVTDSEFARRFFGIWLSPQSSDPKLRTALLGTGAAPATP
jgi:hypothetical protein